MKQDKQITLLLQSNCCYQNFVERHYNTHYCSLIIKYVKNIVLDYQNDIVYRDKFGI